MSVNIRYIWLYLGYIYFIQWNVLFWWWSVYDYGKTYFFTNAEYSKANFWETAINFYSQNNTKVGTRMQNLSLTFSLIFLQGAVHAGIPAIIFGIVATLAGLLSLMLPETLNRKMPESVAEVERSAKKK